MGYIRQVMLTYAVRVAAIPIGVAYGVIAARVLGPVDFGVLVAIGAVIGTVSQIGNLGLPIAALKTAAASPETTPALIANARLVGVATGTLALAALWGWGAFLPATLGDLPQGLLLVAGLALPLAFGSAQFQAISLGRQRVRHYNMVETFNRLMLLASALLVLFVFDLGLTGMVAATVVLAAVHWCAWHVLFGAEASRLAPDGALLRGMAGVSSRAYVTGLLTFLVLRSDMLLINGILGAASVGIYGIAVQGADALLLLPGLAGLILFPRIAAREGDESAALTATVARHTTAFLAIVCAGTALAAWWVVPLLFGEVYRGAVPALWMLLPGVFCIALQMILQNDLSARDYPLVLPVAWACGLAVNVAINVALLSRFGIGVSAASSSIAYALAFGLTLRHWLRRFPSIPPRDLFVLRPEERRTLAARLRSGLSGGAGATGAP